MKSSCSSSPLTVTLLLSRLSVLLCSSTYAVTLYRYDTEVEGRKVAIDFWDTAGQERFASMHAGERDASPVLLSCDTSLLPVLFWLVELHQALTHIASGPCRPLHH